MPHHTPLIGTIVAGLVAAFILGAVAHRLKVSPIAGYLLAGVLVGPFTPGFVADSNLAAELAEIGVILLMFGVGLHFSLRDLLSVRKIAVPGAMVQIAIATVMGTALGTSLGWGILPGLIFGMSLSVASTVVLLRALESRNLIDTERGRIAIGWLIVEDLATVLALVLLPAIALAAGAGGGGGSIALPLFLTVLKIGGFVAFMLVVGKRVIPWALHWVVHTGSRELFRLAVLSIALGVAFGAALVFDVSFALGAFFAGMILGESQLSRRATAETLPLRDAFAVLFFVSVGMLFDPAVVLEQPLPLLATVAIILVGKSAGAYAIVRLFRYDNQTAITVSASLAQIGEFSFILANLGSGLGILPDAARDLVLAGAIISILLHPLIFSLAAKRARRAIELAESNGAPPKHLIVVGYGRVGKLIAERLRLAGRSFVLIDDQYDLPELAKEPGIETVRGNAASIDILQDAGIADASHLLIAIPEGFEAGGIAEIARKLKPEIRIVARAHSAEEVEHLKQHGADRVIRGEEEIARQMIAATA
ncbi:MAG TPA: YbaL family putative K(+) efflux transporter [Sphingomicrobium sp.]|nr:YbaL family putative K(+) efflux transporter [Sphingomicrobium sp.]